MTQQELQAANGGELAQREDVDPILVMIQSAARDPDADVDKMERLMTMYERQQEKHSEAEFNRAMNRVQQSLRRIAADSNNPQTRSMYASYSALDKALRPLYTEHGFSLSFDTGEIDKSDVVRVVCHVSHEAGHTRTYHADMPADGKGAKGGDVMTKIHAAGSAMSYGMRYLLKLIFNVAIGEDDDDGNGASAPERISESEVADIEALIDDVGADRAKFQNYLQRSLKVKDGKLENISKQAYQDVIAALERKRGKS